MIPLLLTPPSVTVLTLRLFAKGLFFGERRHDADQS